MFAFFPKHVNRPYHRLNNLKWGQGGESTIFLINTTQKRIGKNKTKIQLKTVILYTKKIFFVQHARTEQYFFVLYTITVFCFSKKKKILLVYSVGTQFCRQTTTTTTQSRHEF